MHMSDDIAIRVNGLGKKYRISHETASYKTLGETITRAARAPFRRLTGEAPSRSTEEFWALKDVSFEVKRGEVVGIIGRNGAGKSTLLKILSRITTPTEGTIEVHGRIGSLLEVGTGFHPELSGRENIYLSGSILGMKRSEIDAKFDEIVKFAEMEKFLDTPVKRYSSGMYVRLAFAVAAHLEPEILIVDEVLAVGDAAFQKKCLGKMGDVAKEGRTVLFVSHNMVAVKSLCSRALLLRDGRVAFEGQVEPAIDTYLKGGRSLSYRKTWDADIERPHNSSVAINQIAITGSSGTGLQEIHTDTPFNIEVDFEVFSESSTVGLTVIMYDEEERCVLSSINNLEKEWYSKLMPKGRYRSTCTIPGNFFNNGKYSIDINLFGQSYADQCLVKDAITIEILDSPEIRGDYFGHFGGAVRPRFDWRTVPRGI